MIQPSILAGLIVIPITLLLMLGGCRQQPANSPASGKRSQPEHLVEVMRVEKHSLGSRHELIGSLRARRKVHIYNQEEGRITDLPLFEGDRVRKGALLVSLEDDLLVAELAKAKANTRQARLDLKRNQELELRNAASADEVARAKTALQVAVAEQQLFETRLSHTRIFAPFAGVISERLMEPGDVASRHTHILTLSDPSSMVIRLRISELLLPLVHTGDPVEARIDALGDQVFSGNVLRIHPTLDSNTRLGVIEVLLDPTPGGALDGQFARVTLYGAKVARILIPFSSLQRDREGEFVYLMDQDQRVQRQALKSGLRIGDRVEIRAGLQPGQLLVTKGFLGLKTAKRVKPVNLPGTVRTSETLPEKAVEAERQKVSASPGKQGNG